METRVLPRDVCLIITGLMTDSFAFVENLHEMDVIIVLIAIRLRI